MIKKVVGVKWSLNRMFHLVTGRVKRIRQKSKALNESNESFRFTNLKLWLMPVKALMIMSHSFETVR